MISNMARLLNYDPKGSRRHRRIWLAAVTLMAIVASGFLAVPRVEAFQKRQERRTAIREEFNSQLAKAQQSLDKNRIDDVAVEIFLAEFSTRANAPLFWKSERDSFARRTRLCKQRLFDALVIRGAEWNAKVIADHEKGTGGEIECRLCELSSILTDVNASLKIRAAECFKRGQKQVAFAICAQIIQLDPTYLYDDDFWAKFPQ